MKITGKVIDTTLQPLPAANITVTGGDRSGTLGTIADLDGNFSLENDAIRADTPVTVSYMGFVPQTFKASELSGRTVKLEDDTISLAMVTVIGRPKTIAAKQKAVQFRTHLEKHKFVYAGLAAIFGIGLVVAAIKK